MFTTPKPYPKEFRDDVVAVFRKGEDPLNQIATDLGTSRMRSPMSSQLVTPR